VANDPQVAFQAVLHALCLSAFYRYAASTCLEITAKQSGFSAQAPGLAETASAKAIDARHAQWAKQLPETPADLWDTLTAFDSESQSALFAHCASLTVNVVKEPWNRRPDAFAHGDQLARAVSLDMAAAGWKPTVENYLGRVPKARILEAVREAKGEHSAQPGMQPAPEHKSLLLLLFRNEGLVHFLGHHFGTHDAAALQNANARS
jgi:ParB family chromosome partitioning protein